MSHISNKGRNRVEIGSFCGKLPVHFTFIIFCLVNSLSHSVLMSNWNLSLYINIITCSNNFSIFLWILYVE